MKGRDPIKIKLTTSETTAVTMEYIMESLFLLTDKSNKDLPKIALEIYTKILQRGEDGLFIHDWQEMMDKYKLTEYQYFYVLRTLKQAGLIRKSKGKYYKNREFYDHMEKMVLEMNRFYRANGVKI